MTGHVALEELEYSFPGFDLGPISCRFAPGKIYGLLGQNGSGKTTLLNLMAHQLRPAAGRMLGDGRESAWGDDAWKARLCYVRERPAFYDELRVGELLDFASRFHKAWNPVLLASMLERLRLDRGKKVGVLSRGNLVKLGLVMGLASGASLLLLDEPTAGLDPTVRADVQQAVTDLASHLRNPPCVLLSSHIFEDLESVADEILVLRDGRLAFHMARSDITELALYRSDTGASLPVERATLTLTWLDAGARWVLVPRTNPSVASFAGHSGWRAVQASSLLQVIYRGVVCS